MWWVSSLPWEWALVLRILIGSVLCQGILIKYVAQQGRRTERFLWQFVFTFLFALALALAEWDKQRFDTWFLAFVIVGFVGAFGTFYQWKATAISQTRNALFTFWDDIIAMTLAIIFLGEQSFLTPPVTFGIGLSFLALFLFIHHGWLKRKNGNDAGVPMRFYGYVAIYSVLWGVSFFGQKYWAFREFPVSGFLLAWYTGTLLTGLVMCRLYKDPASDQTDFRQIGIRGIALVGLLAIGLFSSMSLTIVAFKAPQVIIQPIFFVSEMVVPALLGLLYWHEKFDRVEWLYFVLGLAGSMIVGLSFHS